MNEEVNKCYVLSPTLAQQKCISYFLKILLSPSLEILIVKTRCNLQNSTFD